MKKLIAFIAFICLLFCLCACEEKPKPPVYEVNDQPTEATLPALEKDSKVDSPKHPGHSSETSNASEDSMLSIVYTQAYAYRDENGIIRTIGIVQVTNTSDSTLSLPLCTMTFTDGDGNTVYTADSVAAFPPVIAPSETACYYEQVEPDLPDIKELTLTPDIPTPTAAEPISYEIKDALLTDSPYGGLVLNGTVTNTTAQDGEVVCVAAVLYSESGNPLAVIQTVLMEPLKAEESAAFSIEDFLLPTEINTNTVSSYAVFSYPL